MRIVAEDGDQLAVIAEGQNFSVTRAVRAGRTRDEESHISLPSDQHIHANRDYFAAGARSLRSISDCSALRNEISVSIVFVNPAWRSLTVLTNARGPCGAP